MNGAERRVGWCAAGALTRLQRRGDPIAYALQELNPNNGVRPSPLSRAAARSGSKIYLLRMCVPALHVSLWRCNRRGFGPHFSAFLSAAPNGGNPTPPGPHARVGAYNASSNTTARSAPPTSAAAPLFRVCVLPPTNGSSGPCCAWPLPRRAAAAAPPLPRFVGAKPLRHDDAQRSWLRGRFRVPHV